MPAVESVVSESGSVHGFDDFEDGSEYGKPLLAIWPAVLFEPLDEFVDGSHAFELFGDNDALLVSVDLSAGEVNDAERGHSGCFEFLIILHSISKVGIFLALRRRLFGKWFCWRLR